MGTTNNDKEKETKRKTLYWPIFSECHLAKVALNIFFQKKRETFAAKKGY